MWPRTLRQDRQLLIPIFQGFFNNKSQKKESLRHIFPSFRYHLEMSCWKCSDSKVATASPLIWNLHKDNLNNVLFSSPWSPLFPPFVLATIGSHLSRRLTETRADWCCLPSPLTCAAQKGGWIMEECSQQGVFLPKTRVCREPLQSITRQVGSPKRCPTAPRNISVQLRFRFKMQQN